MLSELSRYDDALAAYERVLVLKPALADGWLCRGNILNILKRHDEAFAAYERALDLKPDLAEAWLGRGNVLSKFKRYDDALAAYDRALALKPDLAEAWLGRGNTLSELESYDGAFAAYAQALAAKSDLAAAWLGRGNVLTELDRYEEAFAAYDEAFRLNPGLDHLAGQRLYTKLHLCEWTNLESEAAHLLASIRERQSASAPFPLLAVFSSAADQLQCAKRYVQDQPTFPQLWRGEIYAHDRIRVAYLSADFHEHATTNLAAGLFEQHDKSRFETTGISFGPDQNSTMRRRIKAAFEHFVDVQHKSDQDIAEIVRRLEIDIAVDLMGFTKNSRLNVMARRPAPIQVNYLGFPGTMGTSSIDYILADLMVVPEDHRAFYSEQVVWLPDSYQINDNQRLISRRTPTRHECGLPDTAFVFCCFNNSYKIVPEIFDIRTRILAATENSVLWLLDGNATASANLRREAEKAGVASRRLIFAPKMNVADHLARHKLADLFLDTLPCNAHTTASDALWAGLPVLTCPGKTFAGRVAASLLRAIGLDDLIARSLEEYEALALKLAHEPATITTLKERLARSRNTCPLFDTGRTTRQIEAAYTMMWDRYQRGEMQHGSSGESRSTRVA